MNENEKCFNCRKEFDLIRLFNYWIKISREDGSYQDGNFVLCFNCSNKYDLNSANETIFDALKIILDMKRKESD